MNPLSANELRSLRDSFAAALKEVGKCIMDCRRSGNTEGTWEGTQYKAQADLIADSRMREELHRISDIPFISEEDIASQTEDRPAEYWLADPIDGTASFALGFSGFVCQAALIQDGVPKLAGVYAPALDKLYLAIRGEGATLNGRPIEVRSYVSYRHSPILVDNYPSPKGVAAFLFSSLSCSRYVESGSIGLKICLVAEGEADVFVKDVLVRDWDIAAPQLILDEAGGILTQFNGIPFEYRGSFQKHGILAVSGQGLHDHVRIVAERYSPTVRLPEGAQQ